MNETTPSDSAEREPLLERLRGDGAQLEADAGRPVARSFGDPEEEYHALAEAAAVVDDTDRALIRVTPGRKEGRAHETLSGLLTNDFASTPPDAAVYTFLLTAKGGPVAELRAIRRHTEDWLDLPAPCVEGTLAHFEKYLPPLFAEYDVDPSLGRLGVVGPRADDVLRSVAEIDPGGLEPLEGTPATVAGAGALALRRDAVDDPGVDLYVPLDRAAETWDRLSDAAREVGGGPAGLDAREIRRVELGIPVYGREIDEGTLPQETGQTDRAVSFDKGCYTGQEVVVRIEHRGQVNRRLRGLELGVGNGAGRGLPDAGAALYDSGRERGTVTTSVRSPRFGSIALGYVRREVEPGEHLSLEAGGEPTCRVRELPFTG